MRRRDFIQGLAAGACLPAIAHAQQGQPVVGFLSTRSPEEAKTHTDAFRRGLEEMGYVEGRNVAVEYRWAKGDYGRLSSLAADLHDRRLSLVVAAGDPAAKAAKAANFPVPMVFVVGEDPVRAGLVTSMNRPGMATGVNFFTGDLGGKRLALLCSMVPAARVQGLLVNPRFGAEVAEEHRKSITAAARSLGRELRVQQASTETEIGSSFADLVKAGVSGLIVQNDPFFDSRREQILALSSRDRLPGIFHIREFPAGGGPHELWRQPIGYLPPVGSVRRKNPQRREIRRSPGFEADEVRTGRQHQNGKDTRPCRTPIHLDRSRRTDRMIARRSTDRRTPQQALASRR